MFLSLLMCFFILLTCSVSRWVYFDIDFQFCTNDINKKLKLYNLIRSISNLKREQENYNENCAALGRPSKLFSSWKFRKKLWDVGAKYKFENSWVKMSIVTSIKWRLDSEGVVEIDKNPPKTFHFPFERNFLKPFEYHIE